MEQRPPKHSSKYSRQPGVVLLGRLPVLILWLQKVRLAWLSPCGSCQRSPSWALLEPREVRQPSAVLAHGWLQAAANHHSSTAKMPNIVLPFLRKSSHVEQGLQPWMLLSCPTGPHTGHEDLLGSYLMNWEVRDVGCWIWGPRGFGDFHTACQGLPGLIGVHPPLPALGMRKHRLVGAGSAPVPLKSQPGASEHLGYAGHSTSSHTSTSLVFSSCFQTGTDI